jgi:hypothetical protein
MTRLIRKSESLLFEDLPFNAYRSQWARVLNIPVTKLVYEEQCGRLRNEGKRFSVIYSREQMLEWIKRHGRKFFEVN